MTGDNWRNAGYLVKKSQLKGNAVHDRIEIQTTEKRVGRTKRNDHSSRAHYLRRVAWRAREKITIFITPIKNRRER